MDTIFKYIAEGCIFVNKKAYRNQLLLGLRAREARGAIYRDASFRLKREEMPIQSNNVNAGTQKGNSNFQALVDLLSIEKVARIIHENDEEMTPEELVELYHGDKEEFENEILPELGISRKIDKNRITKELAKQPAPLEEEKYAICNFLHDCELIVKEEEEAIKSRLKTSNLAVEVFKGQDFVAKIHCELVGHQEYKIVHLGMHRSSIDRLNAANLHLCVGNTSVKCVFLNTCDSQEVADDLRHQAKIEKIIFWKSKVEDTASRIFSEAFYYYLCLNRRDNYEKFEEAFSYAEKQLLFRNFVLIDPIADVEELEKRKREIARPDLVAAGIPVFYDTSKQVSNDLQPPAVVDPGNCEVMISFNNASAGEDAEELCNFLNRNDKKAFCTRVYCPNNMGDWREYTMTGACSCEILIALMTDGWQKSEECQFEMGLIKNRFAKKEVTVIPVYYSSFDKDYDRKNKHFYSTIFANYQGIPKKESDESWMETILKLLPATES